MGRIPFEYSDDKHIEIAKKLIENLENEDDSVRKTEEELVEFIKAELAERKIDRKNIFAKALITCFFQVLIIFTLSTYLEVKREQLMIEYFSSYACVFFGLIAQHFYFQPVFHKKLE